VVSVQIGRLHRSDFRLDSLNLVYFYLLLTTLTLLTILSYFDFSGISQYSSHRIVTCDYCSIIVIISGNTSHKLRSQAISAFYWFLFNLYYNYYNQL